MLKIQNIMVNSCYFKCQRIYSWIKTLYTNEIYSWYKAYLHKNGPNYKDIAAGSFSLSFNIVASFNIVIFFYSSNFDKAERFLWTRPLLGSFYIGHRHSLTWNPELSKRQPWRPPRGVLIGYMIRGVDVLLDKNYISEKRSQKKRHFRPLNVSRKT